MVTRVLLAVTLSAALLAVSLPVVETARTDRTTAKLDRAVERVNEAGSSLLAKDEAGAGARRVVPISLPPASPTAAGVTRFIISCHDACAIRYQLRSGTSHASRLSLPLSTPAGNVVFSTPGTHRVTLGLERENGRRVVTVRG